MAGAHENRWEEVGDRCYRRRYESYDLNVGLVRGADALLLFDTRCHDGEVAELLDELRRRRSGSTRSSSTGRSATAR